MNVLFTAGTQFPFPRMARVVERIAERCTGWRLVFQAGPGASGDALPSCADVLAQPLFPSAAFNALFQEADLVVTHAGMGNLLLCLEQSKPFYMLPRLACHGEHRNDHQRDTAEAISERYGIPSFYEVEPLVETIVCLQSNALHALELHDAIERERRVFANRLNSLVESL
ncbi:glycosyltransferase [Halomonas sp. A29]|uniref:glycosyltransferase n=1 Tax=Halomonas sp. A29 TaxID=3102786 RepID=UPI00398AF137